MFVVAGALPALGLGVVAEEGSARVEKNLSRLGLADVGGVGYASFGRTGTGREKRSLPGLELSDARRRKGLRMSPVFLRRTRGSDLSLVFFLLWVGVSTGVKWLPGPVSSLGSGAVSGSRM